MKNYKLTIAYDGTPFHGWQVQDNAETIQEFIQRALETILRHPVKIIGSGRTDSGVHALGQVAHFHTETEITLYKVLGSLNGLLPPEIRILNLEEVPASFHSQYSTIGKIYRYEIFLDPVLNPFKRGRAWHIPYKIDVEKMIQASRLFLGTHDFTSFANEAHEGTAAKDPIRTLQRIEFIQQDGALSIEFEGDGFLYKMVRNMVGTLVEIGSGKREPNEINEILEKRDRRAAGASAPPQGLFLVKVIYALL